MSNDEDEVILRRYAVVSRDNLDNSFAGMCCHRMWVIKTVPKSQLGHRANGKFDGLIARVVTGHYADVVIPEQQLPIGLMRV